MDHFLTGFEVAIGACAGLIAWGFIQYFAKVLYVSVFAVFARVFGHPASRNGKGGGK